MKSNANVGISGGAMEASDFDYSRSQTLLSQYNSSGVRILPDFNSVHMANTKSVVRGRNPRAVPRNSELWYHLNHSKARLERISRGHAFWSVIGETESIEGPQAHVGETRVEYAAESVDSGEEDATVGQQHSVAEESQGSDVRSTTLAQIRLARSYRIINGIRFDIEVSRFEKKGNK
jgi:hypothetical protein